MVENLEFTFHGKSMKKYTKGFSNAVCKKFKNRLDAERFIGDEIKENGCDGNMDKSSKELLIAYVDGSYKDNRFGVGCYCLTNDGTYKLKASGVDTFNMHNVAGELYGAVIATQFAIKNGFKEILIVYDYHGIEKWVTGEWKSKNKFTQSYVKKMSELSKKITIKFKKVKAHSGNTYNYIADKLAKESLEVITI